MGVSGIDGDFEMGRREGLRFLKCRGKEAIVISFAGWGRFIMVGGETRVGFSIC